MGQVITVTIEGVLPHLNEEINEAKRVCTVGKGRSARKIPGLLYSKHKKKWTAIVKSYANRDHKRKYNIDERSAFVITWYMPNGMKDCDNIAFAQKYVFDGLVAAKILKTDAWRVTSGGIMHLFEIDKENPRVEVEIHVGRSFSKP